MKQDVNEDGTTPSDFGVSRRTVLQAVGTTAVAGGLFAGTAMANEDCPDLSLEFKYNKETDSWSSNSDLFSVSGGARTVTITNNSNTGDCAYTATLTASGGRCTSGSKTVGPGESVTFTSDDFAPCTAGGSGQQPDLSNVKGTATAAEDGPTGGVVFYGCSQVCTDNPNGVEVEVEGYDGEINWVESNRNDPKASTLGSPVYCFEPGSGAILSAGGVTNPNNCAEANQQDEPVTSAEADAEAEEGDEPEPEA